MFSMDASKMSADQTTQTASGAGQILSGLISAYASPGSIAVGKNASYTESGALSLGNSSGAVLGNSYNVKGKKGGTTMNVQSLDPQVVNDALGLVSDTQQQANDEAAQNTAALKATNDNLTALLGITPPDAGTATDEPTDWMSLLQKYCWWIAGGCLALILLIWLFKGKGK